MRANGKLFIYDYYAAQVDKFSDLLVPVAHRHSFTTIHQLRVTVKRIKAVFQLLQFIYPDFKARDHNTLFKPIFKSSGLIREGQINLKLWRNYSEYEKLREAYTLYLSRSRKYWRKELIEDVKSFNSEKLAKQKEEIMLRFRELGEMESANMSKKFLRSEAESIVNMLDSSGIENCLHDVRITLKNIKPIQGLIVQYEGAGVGEAAAKHLTTTEKYIGRWHDHWILGESVRILHNASGSEGDKILNEYSALMKVLNQQNSREMDFICKWLDITLSDLISDDPSVSSVI